MVHKEQQEWHSDPQELLSVLPIETYPRVTDQREVHTGLSPLFLRHIWSLPAVKSRATQRNVDLFPRSLRVISHRGPVRMVGIELS
jgi:hypothetical protein